MEYEKNTSGKPHTKFILTQPLFWLLNKLKKHIRKKWHEKYKGQKI